MKRTILFLNQLSRFVRMSIAVFLLCKRPFRIIAGFVLSKLGLDKFNFSFDNIELKNGIKLSCGGKFLDPAIPFVVWESWQKQIYVLDKHSAKFGIKPGHVVFDVGANKGLFTVFASTRVGQGRVYSFEPIAQNFAFIQENIRINNLQNVVAEQLAVSSHDGEGEIFLSSNTDDGHGFFRQDSNNKVKVKVVRLHSYCMQKGIGRIDFLKLDCEGSEYDILSGLTTDFGKNIGMIGMEYHTDVPNRKPKDLLGMLANLGFEVLYFKGGFLRAINKNFKL
jgi:FkbM family methyltransferase